MWNNYITILKYFRVIGVALLFITIVMIGKSNFKSFEDWKRILICLLVLSQSVAVLAQDDCWVVRQLKSLATYIDSSTVSGVDTHYLEVPKQPWQVIYQTKLNGVDVKMDSHLGSEELKRYGLEPEDRLDWRTHIKPSTATSMGLWIGYRGFCLSYSF